MSRTDVAAASPRRTERPSGGEPVVERAFALLTAFTVDRTSMGLAELSRTSGLPKSTALRLARALVELGVLVRAEDGTFSIGARLWEIGALAPAVRGLRETALPCMEDLHRITRQHVLLAVREGDEALLVERLSAHAASRIYYQVGGRLPLHSTGVGHVLLALAEFDFQRSYLSRSWRTEPEGSLVSNTQLRRSLAAVRETGQATIVRSAPVDLLSIAAPIWDPPDRVAAALSIVVPVADAEVLAMGRAVCAAAATISRRLRSHRTVAFTPSR